MPIEIRELIIKATVVQDEGGGETQTGSETSTDTQYSEREDIIKICVEKALAFLREKENGR